MSGLAVRVAVASHPSELQDTLVNRRSDKTPTIARRWIGFELRSAPAVALIGFDPCAFLPAPRVLLLVTVWRRPGWSVECGVWVRTLANPDLKLDVNTELAARRTGMAFQRTRLAEDRTLMAVIRTSLSLIGFGFTIFQFFQRLREQDVITKAGAPRHFGVALVVLGVLMLAFGILYHVQFMLGLRRLRESMREDGLIHGETGFPVSLTLITAFLLLLVGVAAIVSMEFQVGPFG